jgi:CheY-like chemotaxis protein
MAESILVIDDDTLMRPSLAVNLERVVYRGRGSAGQALTLIQSYPPEVIFLTARRTKLDWVLRLGPGADDGITRPFDLDVRPADNAATAAQHSPVAARWKQVLAPAALAAGALSFALAAPQTAFHSLLLQAIQAWLNPGGQVDLPSTLTIIVLILAGAAGLA